MLTPAAVARVFPIVRARMGRNAALVDKLIANINAEGQASLAAVLEALYPGQDREKAQANLRQLRLEIAKAAAKKPEVKFALESDNKTRSVPEDRTVWFEGEDRAAESLEDFNRPNIQRNDPVWIPLDAIKQGPAECYIVYAEADKTDAENLIELLRPHCEKAEIKIWIESDILPNEINF